jgi:hypothetical protein
LRCRSCGCWSAQNKSQPCRPARPRKRPPPGRSLPERRAQPATQLGRRRARPRAGHRPASRESTPATLRHPGVAGGAWRTPQQWPVGCSATCPLPFSLPEARPRATVFRPDRFRGNVSTPTLGPGVARSASGGSGRGGMKISTRRGGAYPRRWEYRSCRRTRLRLIFPRRSSHLSGQGCSARLRALLWPPRAHPGATV